MVREEKTKSKGKMKEIIMKPAVGLPPHFRTFVLGSTGDAAVAVKRRASSYSFTSLQSVGLVVASQASRILLCFLTFLDWRVGVD
jgi:hypothetical protein